MTRPMPEVEGAEHRFVEANGVRLHVVEAGEGDPLLLLHGWPQHWYMWRELIGPLAERHRVLCPDLRGSGWSDAPAEGNDPDTFARDQIALLDALDLDQVSVIGHDWGGFTAFLLGIRFPERIERLVALNTPHPWPRIRPRLTLEAWRGWYAAIAATMGAIPSVHVWLARWILTHGHGRDPFTTSELESFAEQYADPDRARAARSLYREYFRQFARGFSGGFDSDRLTVPALLLFGADDLLITRKVLPSYGDRTAAIRIELVRGCGHFVVDERPELVLARATAFLAEV